MIEWLFNLQARARAKRRQDGYNYAAGKLLRGTSEIEMTNFAFSRIPEDEFIQGVQAALFDWHRLNKIAKTWGTANMTGRENLQ